MKQKTYEKLLELAATYPIMRHALWLHFAQPQNDDALIDILCAYAEILIAHCGALEDARCKTEYGIYS